HSKDVCGRQPERSRFRASDARRENLDRITFPRGSVDERLPVGRESRRQNGAATKRHSLKTEIRRSLERRPPSHESSGRAKSRTYETGSQDAAAPPGNGRWGRHGFRGSGRLGKVIPDASQIASEVPRRGVALV